jgi:hypothetical protein
VSLDQSELQSEIDLALRQIKRIEAEHDQDDSEYYVKVIAQWQRYIDHLKKRLQEVANEDRQSDTMALE